MIGPTPWKVIYKSTDRSRERASLHPCALAHWGDYCTPRELTAPNIMVWDHCHVHGYIRGPLCGFHNGRMRHFDRGHARYVHDPDLIQYAQRCAGCVGLN